ncbi:RNA-splicing factor [Malassezia arunalokei]|uniref:RNA-splicing factor n=1 Tax=Malassezia arunalokei TaxID=1514897 RepID=A0AAJ6CMC8_9BASI|nr:RNA-splicing factor [Malassezia arunalokei]
MGAGDLNVKKSWHPRLQKNQEKVWMQEQEAEAERKKLDELRKEREQERQMQELQRIHEAAGGKKRPERVEWMYATPASSSGPSEAELEEYLLGKKRVDKLLQGNEAAQLSRVSDPGSQRDDSTGANSARDMALKIREDPLFAIKKQEQAMQEMLLRDPSRLRQMRARLGLDIGIVITVNEKTGAMMLGGIDMIILIDTMIPLRADDRAPLSLGALMQKSVTHVLHL